MLPLLCAEHATVCRIQRSAQGPGWAGPADYRGTRVHKVHGRHGDVGAEQGDVGVGQGDVGRGRVM